MHTLLIDGSNMLFRTYWVADTRPKLINSKGLWTGPTYLFLKSLKSLTDQFKPDEIIITWDKRLKHPSTNFRKALAPDTYKQNRDTEKTIKVHEQQELLKPWLQSLGVKQIYPWVLEADDIISWLSKDKCQRSTIVSVDKDMLQLIDSNTQYYNPIKKKIININNFEEEVGIKVEHFVYYKALLGDKSDNVDGIDGYGTQKSKKLVVEGYNHILNTLSEDNQKKFLHNIVMMDLNKSYLREEGEVECYESQYNEQKDLQHDMNMFKELCNEAEYYSIAKEMDRWKSTFSRTNTISNLIAQLS
jgi:DNA polymerase-1